MTIVCKLSRAAMAATAAILLLQVQSASAVPILVTLSSSPADLTNLTVGDPVTINVNVSGFTLGDSLSGLSADVLLPDSFFSLPTTPASPLNPTGFFPTSLNLSPNHSASGAYSDMMVGDPPITSPSLFFAFDSVASAVGSGQIFFDQFAPPQLFGTSGSILDINAGAGLPFNITAAGGGPAVVIPEPATLYVALLALLMLRRVARRRRR